MNDLLNAASMSSGNGAQFTCSMLKPFPEGTCVDVNMWLRERSDVPRGHIHSYENGVLYLADSSGVITHAIRIAHIEYIRKV